MAGQGRLLPPVLLLLLLVRPDGRAQRAPAWRQQIRWRSHGRLFSLFNSAAQFQPARGPDGAQSLYLSAQPRATGRGSRWGALGAPSGPAALALPGPEDGSGHPQRPEAPPTLAPGSGARATPARPWQRPPGQERAGSGHEVGAGDDPRSPFKTLNSVFANLHPGGRQRAPGAPPGHRRPGYGTSYFHNGLPDLIPDPYYIQAATYVQRVQMYALRCAAEENCLAR
ncbi:UNVERIFIED_CONTAM: hypothetical protein K2H54_010189 [Gekko kuhli]